MKFELCRRQPDLKIFLNKGKCSYLVVQRMLVHLIQCRAGIFTREDVLFTG